MAWTNKPPLPTAVSGLAAVTADAPSPGAGYRIYAIGGNEGMYPVILVQAYDPATATWSPVPSMSVGRANLAAASTGEKESKVKSGGNVAGAKEIGKLIAERAKAKGIKQVVFDRGGYLYHGRIKALADAAREAGLEF